MYSVDVGDGETKEIPIHELFRFQRETDTSVEGSISCVPEIATRSLEDLQEEIKLQLEAAYALPGNAAVQISRRLLEVWDPSHFPEFQTQAKVLYDYLKREIQRLENERCCSDYSYPATSDSGEHASSSPSYHSTDEYFDYIAERTRHHQQQQKQFRQRQDEEKTVDGFYIPKPHGKNPQPAEGRRWLKQASYDLDAVLNDKGQANEWACFKAHQVTHQCSIYHLCTL